jgi:hypothetical protein
MHVCSPPAIPPPETIPLPIHHLSSVDTHVGLCEPIAALPGMCGAVLVCVPRFWVCVCVCVCMVCRQSIFGLVAQAMRLVVRGRSCSLLCCWSVAVMAVVPCARRT